MIEVAKEKASKIGIRTSFVLNATMLGLIAIAYLGVQTGHLHAAVEVTGWQVGGGTEEHAAREHQLAALSAALPVAAVTPPPVRAPAPLPERKPVQ